MNKNKLYILIIVILSVIVLCLGGLLLYTNADKGNNNQVQYNYKVSSRTTVQTIDSGSINVLVDTQGDVYVYTNNNIGYFGDDSFTKKLESNYQNYSPKGYKDNNGNTTLNGLKLDITDALSVYYVLNKGTSSHFVFIRENGKVSYINVSELLANSNHQIHEIPSLTGVVSIINNVYNRLPYAITIEGEEIDLSEYLV